ncbi:response regulator [Paenibacillus xylanexedens]|uniref:response regulator n=1 Tax=Paenibacillus xylanexedens TaxID=528191 RepID=UPI000FA80174|nr:response regulator [Paenibacillus xylanexedens]RPK26344.1 hypothetical protein EDO6_04899 [Paenibacillus xylanexedens]
MTLSIMIVDDDVVSRSMLNDIIESCGIGELAGMAEGGIEGARMIMDLRPDAVLIDLLMPDQDGIEIVAKLKRRPTRTALNSSFINRLIGWKWSMCSTK